jgi:aspartate/methionine/tyrosine aminotransferase
LAEDRLMVLNGTREGLFNACIALCPETKQGQRPVVLMPNPFYQVYAVAALTVGAEPVYVPATAATGFLPDYGSLPKDVLDRTAIAYICSPANPQGAVASADYLADLLALAERHDFTVLADECYSEIWRDAPPPGLLQVAAGQGADPERAVVFHSLSKRSNLPGLRSGFVASGPESMKRIRQLRSFAGAPLPLPLQRVAEAAWSDEAHVIASRALYHQKFADADRIFAGLQGYQPPGGGFFLWLPVDDGEQAALKLWRETGVRVLPGAYLSRDAGGQNPGKNYIRVALVATPEETQRGLTLLRGCIYG